MSNMHVTTAVAADRTVVAVAGECDLHTRDELIATLTAAVREAPLVEVDLAQVRFLDSSGLHALVTAYRAAQAQGRRLYVVNATGTAATILDMTGVIELLRPPVDG